MTQAIWNGVVVAESDRCKVIEGNYYFPPDSVRRGHLRPSTKHTACPRKGVASYYDVVVDGKVNCKAAWCYSQPKDAARDIKDYIAFWHGVQVVP